VPTTFARLTLIWHGPVGVLGFGGMASITMWTAPEKPTVSPFRATVLGNWSQLTGMEEGTE
jgi:hypothetical protein